MPTPSLTPILDKLFVDAADIVRLYHGNMHTVIIWGSGDYANMIQMTLEAHSIPVAYFCNDKIEKQNETDSGGKTVKPERLRDIPHPFVVIGTDRFQDAVERLSAMGIKDVYALRECLKYPYAEHLADRQELNEYFTRNEENSSERILLEIYGNIGDLLVKSGIIRFLLSRYGHDNLYIACDHLWGDGGADFLRLFTDKVISIDRARFADDRQYRLGLLRQLNGFYFDCTICLCNVTYLSRRRCLNHINFNVRNVFAKRELHFHKYIPAHDVTFIKELFPDARSATLSPQGSLTGLLDHLEISQKLPNRFVAVCMGASNSIRCYNAEQFAVAANYLIHRGYNLVFLGYGEKEEKYQAELMRHIETPSQVTSLISRLSVTQSLAVIEKSAFFLGVESGMWNASYILGKPSVVLYGGGDFTGFRHNWPAIEYVTINDHACFGCRWVCTNLTPNGKARCVETISPEQILHSLDRIIAHLHSTTTG